MIGIRTHRYDLFSFAVVLSFAVSSESGASTEGGDLDSWLSGWAKKTSSPRQLLNLTAAQVPATPPQKTGQRTAHSNAGNKESATSLGRSLVASDKLIGRDPERPDDKKRPLAGPAAPSTAGGSMPKRARSNNERTPAQLNRSTRILEEHLGISAGRLSARDRVRQTDRERERNRAARRHVANPPRSIAHRQAARADPRAGTRPPPTGFNLQRA